MKASNFNAVGPDEQAKQKLGEIIRAARLLFLGETNHFVREKTDFRLWWLQQLPTDRPVILGEELSWTDGRHVQAYLQDGDPGHLYKAATFGGSGHLRQDRNDKLTGVFSANEESYPHKEMLNEHRLFYDGLRDLNIDCFFGFDVDAIGAAYSVLLKTKADPQSAKLDDRFWAEIGRVNGETLAEEIQKLQGVLKRYQGESGFEAVEEDLLSLIESIEYFVLVNGATNYEAVAPAMAFREQTMKRRVNRILNGVPEDALVVLMGHAYHLARDDGQIHSEAVGPGGGQVSSLGHHLVQEQGYRAASVWMVYGGGRDCQPLPDLPQVADFPDDTLNAALGRGAGETCRVYSTDDEELSDGPVRLGNMYNLVDRVDLSAQADAVMFFPVVSPLRDSG